MTKLSEKTERRYDFFLNLAICFLVGGLFMTNYSVGLQNYIEGITPDRASTISKIVIVISMGLCVPALINRFQPKMFWITIGVALVYLLQILLFPKQQFIFKYTSKTFLLTVYPAVICFLALRDYRSLLVWLLRLSLIISFICLITMLFYGAQFFAGQYVMGFSNALILPTDTLLLFLTDDATPASKKLLYGALTISNSLCICIYGSRGALAAVIFFAFYVILKAKTSTTKKFLICSVLLVFGLLFVLYFQTLMESLNDWLIDMGFKSRTIGLILSDISHDSGRFDIWTYLINDLQENIFAVRGINAEYLILGGYAHNFVLELVYNLGPVFASIIIVYILYCFVTTVLAPINPYSKILGLIVFAFFPVSLWSGSIWTSMYFWIWIFLYQRDLVKSDQPTKENK